MKEKNCGNCNHVINPGERHLALPKGYLRKCVLIVSLFPHVEQVKD